MRKTIMTFQEAQAQIYGELGRTPRSDKDRCKKLSSIITRMEKIQRELIDLHIVAQIVK